jgi:hypothetical protein
MRTTHTAGVRRPHIVVSEVSRCLSQEVRVPQPERSASRFLRVVESIGIEENVVRYFEVECWWLASEELRLL